MNFYQAIGLILIGASFIPSWRLCLLAVGIALVVIGKRK